MEHLLKSPYTSLPFKKITFTVRGCTPQVIFLRRLVYENFRRRSNLYLFASSSNFNKVVSYNRANTFVSNPYFGESIKVPTPSQIAQSKKQKPLTVERLRR
jgi:hypothetical protein